MPNKWIHEPLKGRFYDDEIGFDGLAGDAIENEPQLFASRPSSLPHRPEHVRAPGIARLPTASLDQAN